MLPIPESVYNLWEKGLRHIGPEGILLMAAAALIVGVIVCLFGHRLFRVLTTIGGMLAGAGAGLYFSLGFGPTFQLAYTLGGAVLGAAVGFALYWAWVFLFGFGLLALVGLKFTRSLEVSLVAGLVGGILAVVFRHYFLIAATAFVGAGSAAWGGYLGMLCLKSPGLAQSFADNTLGAPSTIPFEVFAITLVLGVLGLFVQLYMYRRWRARQEHPRANARKKGKHRGRRPAKKTAPEQKAKQEEFDPVEDLTPAQRRRYEAIHGKAAPKPKRTGIFNPQDLAPKEGAKTKIFQEPPPAREGEPELNLGQKAGQNPDAQSPLRSPGQKKKPKPGLGRKRTKGTGEII